MSCPEGSFYAFGAFLWGKAKKLMTLFTRACLRELQLLI